MTQATVYVEWYYVMKWVNRQGEVKTAYSTDDESFIDILGIVLNKLASNNIVEAALFENGNLVASRLVEHDLQIPRITKDLHNSREDRSHPTNATLTYIS